tara:strand:+ start:419 stop:751 length:333 start_codon:yes stop_codon:yes gene_type:complete
MSNFFDSEIVREELQNINGLQEGIYNSGFSFDTMSREEQVEHIENLTELLNKQRIMYTRLSLSDDPDAKKMKLQLENSISSLGFPPGTDISVLFNGMMNTIESLKQRIDL